MVTAMAVCGFTLNSHGDIIRLKNKDLLSGTISSLSNDGEIVFNAKNLETVAKFDAGQIESINFQEAHDLPKASQLFVFKNGDLLPGALTKINETSIKVVPIFNEEPLDFPRSDLKTILFGINSKKPIYEGPNSIEEWSAKNWIYSNHRIISRGNGHISKNVSLPDEFSIKFRYSWKGSPFMRFYLGDSSGDVKTPQDRYYLYVTQSAIKFVRQYKDSRIQDQPLKVSQINPNSIRDNFLDIEIKGNLKTGVFTMSLRDETDILITDNFNKGIPKFGTGIIFHNLSNKDKQSTISNIRITPWSPQSDAHKKEALEQTSSDVIITTESDRLVGELLDFTKTETDSLLLLKTTLKDEPLSIPEQYISAIVLAHKETLTPTKSEGYRLKLRQNGNITAQNLTVNSNNITCDHNTLGHITLDRRFVESIEFHQEPKEQPSE